jgi:hypothetical protein
MKNNYFFFIVFVFYLFGTLSCNNRHRFNDNDDLGNSRNSQAKEPENEYVARERFKNCITKETKILLMYEDEMNSIAYYPSHSFDEAKKNQKKEVIIVVKQEPSTFPIVYGRIDTRFVWYDNINDLNKTIDYWKENNICAITDFIDDCSDCYCCAITGCFNNKTPTFAIFSFGYGHLLIKMNISGSSKKNLKPLINKAYSCIEEAGGLK